MSINPIILTLRIFVKFKFKLTPKALHFFYALAMDIKNGRALIVRSSYKQCVIHIAAYFKNDDTTNTINFNDDKIL